MPEKRANIIVIIPAYNAEKCLYNAVQSVLNQPYSCKEIVIVNDGSKDSTAEICSGLEKEFKNIHAISQVNAGTSAARNKGIEYSLSKLTGDDEEAYIAFLDADDAWSRNFLNDEVANLLNQDFQLIGFQSCICNADLTYRCEPRSLKQRGLRGGEKNIWCHSTQHFGAMFYSAKFLKSYQIRFEKIKYSEDKMFSQETCYLADRIYLAPRLMYLYRQSPSSLVHIRPFATDYYPPIIDAYLQFDQKMAKWGNQDRGVMQRGEKIAKFYLMDMIDEHFQHFRSKKALENYFADHKDYADILLKNTGNDVAEKRYEEMCQNPAKHRVKNWITGAKEYLGRLALEIPFARKLREKKRFTIKVSGYEENSVSNP